MEYKEYSLALTMYVVYVISKTTGLIFYQNSGCNILRVYTSEILSLHIQCEGCLKGDDYFVWW
jgi:hypothetical protein